MKNYTPSENFNLRREEYLPSKNFIFEDTFGAALEVPGIYSAGSVGSLVGVAVSAGQVVIPIVSNNSKSEVGVLDCQIDGVTLVEIRGIDSVSAPKRLSVEATVLLNILGLDSKGYASLEEDPFSGKSGDSVDLRFGPGWPSQTANDLKLHFYRYQSFLEGFLDKVSYESVGTVPKVKGFVQFDFRQGYEGVDPEFLSFGFNSVTEYLDATLSRIVPKIFGDSSNVAEVFSVLGSVSTSFYGLHTAGNLACVSGTISFQNVGIHSNGTLVKILSDFTTNISVRVPIAISVKISITTSSTSASILGRYARGELNRLLDKCTAEFFGGIGHRGYLNGTLAGVNRNISGEYHSPVTGILRAYSSEVSVSVSSFFLMPRIGTFVMPLGPVYVRADASLVTTGKWRSYLEDYYEPLEDFEIDGEYYFLQNSRSIVQHFRQPQYGLASSIHALHAYGYLSATTGASALTTLGGLNCSGALTRGWGGYERKEDFNLLEGDRYKSLDFIFEDPNGISAQFLGIFPGSINKAFLEDLNSLFLGRVEIEGLLLGDAEYTSQQPYVFQFSNNRIQIHEYNFYWKVPGVQPITSNIIGVVIYGPYGTLNAALSPVSVSIRGFGHVYGDIVSYSNNIDYSKWYSLDLQTGYEDTTNFDWWYDSLGLKAVIVATSTEEFPIFHKRLDSVVSGILLNTPYYPTPVPITGRFHNPADYVPPLPESNKDFVLEVDDLRWFVESTHTLEFDRSTLDLSAGVFVKHLPRRAGSISRTLSSVVTEILGIGEILGYWGGEYRVPEELKLDFDKYGWYQNLARDFMWNYSPHLEDSYMVVRGGEVSGQIVQYLSNLQPQIKLSHPVPISGTLLTSTTGFSVELILMVSKNVEISIVTKDVETKIELLTWVKGEALLDILTGSPKILMQGRFPTVMRLANYGPLMVYSSVKAQTPFLIQSVIFKTLEGVHWRNLDSSRRGLIYITSSLLEKADIKGRLSVEGTLQGILISSSSKIGGRATIYGTWEDGDLETHLEIEAVIPDPVYAHFSGTFDDCRLFGLGLGTVHGNLYPDPKVPLSISEKLSKFLGFIETRGDLVPKTDGYYTEIRGLIPGNYFGGLSVPANHLKVEAEFSGEVLLRAILNSNTGSLIPTILGSSLGIIFKLKTGEISLNLRLRGIIQGSASRNLEDLSGSFLGGVPKAVQGFLESELRGVILYAKLQIEIEGTLEERLIPLKAQIYGSGVVGSIPSAMTSSLIPNIVGARQGLLYATLRILPEDSFVEISGRSTIFGRMLPSLERFGLDVSGKVPIKHFGIIRSSTRTLFANFAGKRAIDVKAEISSRLDNLITMLKGYTPHSGSASLLTEDLRRRFVGLVPIAIETIVDIRIGSGFYTEIKAVMPTKGFMDTELSDFRTNLKVVFFVGKMWGELSKIEANATGRILSNTKARLVPITGSPELKISLMIYTEGTIESSNLGAGLTFQAEARIPPNLVRIRGSAHFSTKNLVSEISGTHYCFKVNIDLYPDGVRGEIRAHVLTNGNIDTTMYTVLPDIVGISEGYRVHLEANVGDFIGRFKAAFLVFGFLTPRLQNLLLTVEHYVPSIKVGTLTLRTDHNNNITSSPKLATFFYGLVPTIIHGRFETFCGDLHSIDVWARTPIDLFGIFPGTTATLGIQILGYCDIAGEIRSGPQRIDSTFVGTNSSFVLDIVLDRNDKTLYSSIKMHSPGGISGKAFLKMEGLLPTLVLRGTVFVKFDAKTSPFRLSRIVGNLGVTGNWMGGDKMPTEWSSPTSGKTIYDYQAPLAPTPAKKISDVIKEAGRNPGDMGAPENKKFWTLDYFTTEILLRHPIPNSGELHNMWSPEDYLDDWWLLTEHSVAQGRFFPQYDKNPFKVTCEMRGYVPVQGIMNINGYKNDATGEDIAGYDLAIVVAWPVFPGFKGFLENYHYKGTFNRKIRDLKALIEIDFRNFEAESHNNLHSAKFLAQGIVLGSGSMNMQTSSIRTVFEMTAAHKTGMILNSSTESLLPRIRLEILEYIYGVFFQSFFLVNEDVAEVDSEYLPSRLQYRGLTALFGSLTIDMYADINSWTYGNFKLESQGTFASIKTRLAPLRPRIPGKHVGFSIVQAGMNLYLDRVTSTGFGVLATNGWLVLRGLLVGAEIEITAPHTSKGILGDDPLESVLVDMTVFAQIWGELTTALEDSILEISAGHTLPVDGTLEEALEKFNSTIVACITAEANLSVTLDDVASMAGFAFGPNGYFEKMLTPIASEMLLSRYYPSSVVPPEYGRVVSGDVNYNYDRNKGAAVRIYDNETEEVLFVSHLTSQDEGYSFANVMEGEYYVVGVPTNRNFGSEVLDELDVELDI